MKVARRIPGAGVRKPPREETAGGVERPRVRLYGISTLAVLPKCMNACLGSDQGGDGPGSVWKAAVSCRHGEAILLIIVVRGPPSATHLLNDI
jgi:hypothetical protein